MLYSILFQVASVLLPCLPRGRLEETQEILQEGCQGVVGAQDVAGGRLATKVKKMLGRPVYRLTQTSVVHTCCVSDCLEMAGNVLGGM